MGFDTELPKPVKCDLCNGEPQCVKFCPSEALKYEEIVDSVTKTQKQVATKSLWIQKYRVIIRKINRDKKFL